MGSFMGALARRLTIAATAAATLVVPLAVTAPAANAAGTVKASVSLTGPTSGTYGTTVKLAGTAWRTGTATKLVRATVWLQRATHGKTNWGNVTKTSTSSTGGFTFAVVQSSAYDYRAHYPGSPTYTAAWSPVRYPAVLQKVIFDSVRTLDPDVADNNLGTLQATGRVFPTPPANTVVWLQRYDYTAKAWKNYISGRTAGGNSVTIRGDVVGSTSTYRLTTALRYPYAAGSSGSARFAHYVQRGLFTHPIAAHGGIDNTPAPGHYLTTPGEDPLREWVNLWSLAGGSSWIEAQTTGCTRVDAAVVNISSDFTPTQVQAGILHAGGTGFITAYPVAPGAYREFGAATNGAARLRFQLKDLGTGGTPMSIWYISGRCATS